MRVLRTEIEFVNSPSCSVLLIPKCASQSLSTLGEVTLHPKHVQVLAFIRDPIDRLKSVFRHFGELQNRRGIPDTWAGFVDHVLSGVYDRHWAPQSAFLSPGFELRRFEALAETSAGFGWKLPWIHRTAPQSIKSYRDSDLRNWYAEDYILRDALNG